MRRGTCSCSSCPVVPQHLRAGEQTRCCGWLLTSPSSSSKTPAARESTADVVHFRAAEINQQIDMLYAADRSEDVDSIALIFYSEQQMERPKITPTVTLAMNILPPGDFQRAHRHNSVAVTLVVKGDDCFSVVDERRKDWSP